MKKSLFKGSGVAIVTPFHANGEINFDEFERLIEFQLENNTDALIVCGSTGEGSTLTYDERDALIACAVQKVAGRIPVIGGCGSNSTDNALRLSQGAKASGADALLSVSPFYNKPTHRGLIEHYTKIAKTVDLPIILYNIPGRTGSNIEPATMLELSKIDNISGVKESAGDIVQVARIAALCGDNFDIYAGNDNEILPVLALGGKGTISALANIAPKNVNEMVHSYLRGEHEKARKLQLNAIQLIDMIFCETNPIPVKAALNAMGYNVGGYRLPLTAMNPENFKYLEAVMEDYGLL